MLGDHDIEKLCHGRIILASFYNNAERRDSAGLHFAMILDSNEEVKEHDSYFVAVISHSEESNFRIPVPGYTGLDGFVQCDWIEEAHLPGIVKVGETIRTPEMAKILQLVRAARVAKQKK